MSYKLRGKVIIHQPTGAEVARYPKRREARQALVHLQESEASGEAETLFQQVALRLPEGEGEPTGKAWDVTVIGGEEKLITVEGREYVRSNNGRLYAVDKLESSTPLWEGVKVYDNHLTQEEFEKKGGMRSVAGEWIGTLVKPYWDKAARAVKATFHVVDNSLASKLKAAHESNVLGAIGLSIDTFTEMGSAINFEGKQYPVIEGFKKIVSVDLVAEPAAGGRFNRILASEQKEQNKMDREEILALIQEAIQGAIPDAVSSALATTLEAKKEEEVEEEVVDEDPPEEEVEEEAVVKPEKDTAVEAAVQEARLARCELLLERKLGAAKLPEKFSETVRTVFAGRVFEEKELNAVIKSMKEAQASQDPGGQVQENGQTKGKVEVGLTGEDKFALEAMRLIMRPNHFRDLEGKQSDDLVNERIVEAGVYGEWLKAGKPNTGNYATISQLLRDWFDGDPLLDGRAYEAMTTTTLSTVVKNTVNIMTAADYSVRQRWYEPIVTTEEVTTIDDSTLARVYGYSNLSVVDEGQAYTALTGADEEETASFVKHGNYVGVTIETLMRDKLNYVRSIPMRLSNAWFNTLSAKVSAVFTVNSAAGPVLSDTGALFNATAVTTAGGHANLLTTAYGANGAAHGAARLAMRAQTDQPLGAGQKLLINPRYVLVPTNLETTAITVRNSEQLPGGANNDINPYYQNFEMIVVPNWTDATDWALVADPQQFPAIYLIFPRGNRTPQLFTSNNDAQGAMFTNDEMRWKVRMMTYRFSATYDCAPVADFRPLHKSNVA